MSDTSTMLRGLNQKPIAYYPIYKEMTGSLHAGILLSQLMRWFTKKDRFSKTNAEIIEETLLTQEELRSAKKRVSKLGFIKITREGLPAKTWYAIEWDGYIDALNMANEKGM
jgi:hypothetical protein